ncbi:DUF5133 domain-containing protein [Streptomyces sp. NPDC058637]|uniref:DUF5133 domain-containing protein n=1 Tax=Streptomyces sp. NPDC058637 TaxID=3346569 RepID=UPI00365A28DD
MLVAHPAILRSLLQRYETLLAQDTGQCSAGIRRELEDVTYTLCVSTGTLTAEAALAKARQQLAAALADQPVGDVQLTS